MSELDFEILHKNVYYFPNAITNVSSIMEKVETFESNSVSAWDVWYANSEEKIHPYGQLKELTPELIADEPLSSTVETAEYIINGLLGPMESCCSIYMKEHGATEADIDELHKNMFDVGATYGIRRYDSGGEMGPHPDRTEDGRDTYTISVYLDDEHVGGELGIQVPGAADKIVVKPKAGSIVVFPSGYLHESMRLLDGRKTIITHVHTLNRNILD